MGSKHKHKIVPMVASGIQHLVRRTYAEGGARQWVRETYVNAIEAGATRVEDGGEGEAGGKRGGYRRQMAAHGQRVEGVASRGKAGRLPAHDRRRRPRDDGGATPGVLQHLRLRRQGDRGRP